MICHNCGAHLAENAEYCPNCGSLCRPAQEGEAAPRRAAAGAPPAGRPVYAVKAERVGTYLFWWTVALFSNVGLVCFTLSIVFALNGGNKNRVAFFRAVLLFKLILLLVGVVAVVVLSLCGFSFTALLNSIDFSGVLNWIKEVI